MREQMYVIKLTLNTNQFIYRVGQMPLNYSEAMDMYLMYTQWEHSGDWTADVITVEQAVVLEEKMTEENTWIMN